MPAPRHPRRPAASPPPARRRPTRGPRRALAQHQHGQATVEYVAVLGLLAALLLAGTTVALAPGLANAVQRGMARALCLVTGDGCADAIQEACVRSTRGNTADVGVKVLIFRGGRRGALLRSERSDGTFELTLLDGGDLGVAAEAGARAQLGGFGLGAAAGVTAGVGADHTRTWRVRSRRAADRLQAALVHHLLGNVIGQDAPIGRVVQAGLDIGDGRPLPPHTVEVRRIEGAARAEATADLIERRSERDAAADQASSTRAADVAAGWQVAVARGVDRTTGERTTVLELQGEVGGALAGHARGDHRLDVTVVTDRDGRPLTLSMPGDPTSVPAEVRGRDADVEVARTLDLTRPSVAPLLPALLRNLRAGRVLAAREVARVLGRRIATDGRVDVRRYAREEDQPLAVSGEVGLGVGVGVHATWTRTSARLLDAWTLPAGGVWERRLDCLASPA